MALPPRLLALLCLALLVACGGDSDPPTGTDTPGAGATEAKPTTAAQPTAGGTPLANDEPVGFQAGDGVVLRGHLYSVPGPKRQVIVLASTVAQSTWRPYVAEFAGHGIALLTIDPRGVGETGGAKNDATLQADLDLAVRYIQSREYPLVYLVGIGAPVSHAVFRVATQQDLAGVAGLPIGGLTPDDIARVSESKLFMAFQSDTESVQNIDRLMAAAPEPKRRLIVTTEPTSPNLDVLSLSQIRQALLEFVAR
jgi:hypothetical protein